MIAPTKINQTRSMLYMFYIYTTEQLKDLRPTTYRKKLSNIGFYWKYNARSTKLPSRFRVISKLLLYLSNLIRYSLKLTKYQFGHYTTFYHSVKRLHRFKATKIHE